MRMNALMYPTGFIQSGCGSPGFLPPRKDPDAVRLAVADAHSEKAAFRRA